MVKHVDWFNIMTYDIHGTWDGQNKWSKEVINPHTNLTGQHTLLCVFRYNSNSNCLEITSSLDLLWRNDIPSKKVLLGLGFYARSFELDDPGCTTPGCPFVRNNGTDSGGAKPGECTLNSGTLSDYEINRIVKKKSPNVVYDKEAAVNWMSWDSTQWYGSNLL